MKATINKLLLSKTTYINTSGKFNSYQKRHLVAIGKCRTKYLGGRKLECNNCKSTQIVYNSCRNRHCPQCQSSNRENWIAARENDVLPVKYFHVVFTLPSELNQLALAFSKQVYNALFTASWQTIQTFSKDEKQLGAKTGMTCILHTWGQNLSLHPHLHCIVPSGGIDDKGKWKSTKSKGKFLFPVKAMSKVFRAKYVTQLRINLKAINKTLPQQIAKALFEKDWIVYAKRPFGGAKQVIEYLGRYSHKVAISNSRINAIENQTVSFSYKDYKDNGKRKEMKMQANEFIRRYSMHILPNKFMRIRHYGILSSRKKKDCINAIRKQLLPKSKEWKALPKQDYKSILLEKYNVDVSKCNQCKKGSLIEKEKLLPIKQKPKLFLKQL